MFMTKRNRLQNDERGFASLVIALILIIVLALLTVAFAQLARREQQSALDKQLAVQANYAAESGINDVVSDLSAIQTDIDNNVTIPSNQCLGEATSANPRNPIASGSSVVLNGQIDSVNGVSYSCVLLNLNPPFLKKALSKDNGWTTTFATTGAGALNSLTFAWSSADATPRVNLRTDTQLPPYGSWTSPAVLQVNVTPITAVDRQSLISNTFTDYMFPENGGGSVAYNPSAQAPLTTASCNAGTCSVTINGLPGVAGAPFLVHVYDYYDDSNVTITANNGALDFVGGQAFIDVTGVAKDVLKRLQVSYPLTNNGLTNYALQADNICKRIETAPNETDPSGAAVGGTTYGPISGAPADTGQCGLGSVGLPAGSTN